MTSCWWLSWKYMIGIWVHRWTAIISRIRVCIKIFGTGKGGSTLTLHYHLSDEFDQKRWKEGTMKKTTIRDEIRWDCCKYGRRFGGLNADGINRVFFSARPQPRRKPQMHHQLNRATLLDQNGSSAYGRGTYVLKLMALTIWLKTDLTPTRTPFVGTR